jgi:hypothetical protein
MRTLGWRGLISILVALSGWATNGKAGPNEGGVLVIHSDPDVIYSAGTDYGGQSGFGCPEDPDCPGTPVECSCGTLVSEVPGPAPGGSAYVCWVYAAFPEGACPRVKGLAFGVDWTSINDMTIGAWGTSASLEVPTTSPSWPQYGSGTALTWASAVRSTFFEVYWFALYAYYDTTFELGPHPSSGGVFADDAVPAHLDLIAGYGALGIGVPGSNPPVPSCPDTGACCFDLVCGVLTHDECDQNGGEFMGQGTSCDPNPCLPVVGACCFTDVCEMHTSLECSQSGGEFLGVGTSCDPNPCLPPSCEVTPAAIDFAEVMVGLTATEGFTIRNAGGGTLAGTVTESCSDFEIVGPADFELFAGDSASFVLQFSPTTEGQHDCLLDLGASECQFLTATGTGVPPTGACCVAEVCEIQSQSDCEGSGGVFIGDFSTCSPNPCYGLSGACCLPNGLCVYVSLQSCEDNGWDYVGHGVPCDPDPCLPQGACCFADGTCLREIEEDCGTGDGTYLGDDSECNPNPCPQPGACCVEGGGCQILLASECDAIQGIFQGEGSSCNPNPCTGACCNVLDCGVCYIVAEESDCVLGGASFEFQGFGTVCDPSPCTVDGACCFEGDICIVISCNDCTAINPYGFFGPGSTCDPNPCPTSGVQGPSELPREVSLSPPAPNPTRSRIAFNIDLPSPGHVRVRLFDVSGHLVAGVVDRDMTAGSHPIVWTPQRDLGQTIPGGIYYLVLEGPDKRQARKLVVAR